jgi:hypothetical protein
MRRREKGEMDIPVSSVISRAHKATEARFRTCLTLQSS